MNQSRLTVFLVVVALIGAGIAGVVIAWTDWGMNIKARFGPPPPQWTTCAWPRSLPPGEPLDTIHRISVHFDDNQRFSISCPKMPDPRNSQMPKFLGSDPGDRRGITHNACVRIEGDEYMFGVELPGARYIREKGKIMKEVPIPGKDPDRAWQAVWEVEGSRIRVTQSVEIIMGDQTRLYDTALVRYQIWNRDKTPHKVGLRFMLDGAIGTSSGVPFYVPPVMRDGRVAKPARFVDKMELFPQRDIPDFIQALESTKELNDSAAMVALLGLKIKGAEPLDKLVICRWPQNSEARWGGTGQPGDWLYEPMDNNPNAKGSCVVLYWAQDNMKPGEKRELAFTYGLGNFYDNFERAEDRRSRRMQLCTAPSVQLHKPFPVFVYLRDFPPRQAVTLRLPTGLTLTDDSPATQYAPSPGLAQITWRVSAGETGAFIIEADGSELGMTMRRVLVPSPPCIFPCE